MSRRHSIQRISGWSVFLAAALLLALCFVYLPHFLELDRFRPEILQQLEATFHCDAEIGHVRAQIFPAPSLAVSRMSLVDPADPRRIFASGTVRLELAWKELFLGRIRFKTLRFIRPRFIAHRVVDRTGAVHWLQLSFPAPARPARPSSIENIEIRAGRLELWDHRTEPVTRWIIDQLSGAYEMRSKQGSFTGSAGIRGYRNRLEARYNEAQEYPLVIQVKKLRLEALQALIAPSALRQFSGECALTVQARYQPSWAFRATLNPLRFDRLPGKRWSGFLTFNGRKLDSQVKTLGEKPVVLTLNADLPSKGWSLQGTVSGYDPEIGHQLYDQAWLNRLAGGGAISFKANGQSPTSWHWDAAGRNFHLAKSVFDIPDWSAQGDARRMLVYVRAATPAGGAGEVVWEKSTASPDSTLTVTVASVTVRDLLQIYQLEAKPGAIPANGMNPYAYEKWRVDRGDMEALIRSTGTLELRDSDINVAGMHLDLTGSFGIRPSTPTARIQGDVYYVALADRISEFNRERSPISGVANADFDLTIPLNAKWLNGLTGWVQFNSVNGVLRELKTFYRVMSVFNLTNYLKFHMPQVDAEGVTYQSLTGRIWLKDGLAVSDDLFLRSPNMNIGIKGAADLPMKRVDLTVRLEVIRFLEDVLKNLPLIRRIFDKPNKIFLPAVVRVKGPWANPDVN